MAEPVKPQVKKRVRKELTPEQKVKRDGERHAKFRELAIDRVPRALHRIKIVQALASKASYVYTDEEAQKIIDALREAVADLSTAFTSRSVQTQTFTF